jgi:hypothetical protein
LGLGLGLGLIVRAGRGKEVGSVRWFCIASRCLVGSARIGAVGWDEIEVMLPRAESGCGVAGETKDLREGAWWVLSRFGRMYSVL